MASEGEEDFGTGESEPGEGGRGRAGGGSGTRSEAMVGQDVHVVGEAAGVAVVVSSEDEGSGDDTDLVIDRMLKALGTRDSRGIALETTPIGQAATPLSGLRHRRCRVSADEEPNEGDTSSRSLLGSLEHVVNRVKTLKKELECGVCLEMLVQPTTTVCGHTFCKICLKTSFKIKRFCPICKAPVPLPKEDFVISVILWNIIQLMFPEHIAGRWLKKLD
ncbi:hypothetical protein KC19_10G060700 [Ceratodon purpureus]|uniref:RING-type domain-containing protein n=1 Tax=Ceratodon purpureus TaxID=3225 RepID=A0A8T0GPE6_CERPU|nr:hypothetical protein KC19_10G060700 [Ceratodon purpureus]